MWAKTACYFCFNYDVNNYASVIFMKCHFHRLFASFIILGGGYLLRCENVHQLSLFGSFNKLRGLFAKEKRDTNQGYFASFSIVRGYL